MFSKAIILSNIFSQLFQVQTSISNQPFLHLPSVGNQGWVQCQIPDERLLREEVGTGRQRSKARTENRTPAHHSVSDYEEEKLV